MAATSYLTLLQTLAQRLGGYASGSVSSATSTTLVDAANRFEGDDTFQNAYVVLTSGSSSGTSNARLCTSSSQSTNTLTIAGTWASTPLAAATYSVFLAPYWPDRLKSAIQVARSRVIREIPNYDETLYRPARLETTITLPSTQLAISQVAVGQPELCTNNDFRAGSTSGWTVHANSTLTNAADVADQQVLRHVAAGAGEVDAIAASVYGGLQYTVGAGLFGMTAGVAVTYAWLDASGATLGTATAVTGSPVTAAALTHLRSLRVTAPENATQIKISFSSNGAGTYDIRYAAVSQAGPYSVLPAGRWEVRRDGQTRYLELLIRPDRDVRVYGVVEHSTLSADTDTIGLDTPEIEAFYTAAKLAFVKEFSTFFVQQPTIQSQIPQWEREYRDFVSQMSEIETAAMECGYAPFAGAQTWTWGTKGLW